MKKNKLLKSLVFVALFVCSSLLLYKLEFCNKQVKNILNILNSNKNSPTIQNDKNDVLYGETLYPEQIKAVINKYNTKHSINILFAETKEEFLKLLADNKITENPFAIYQYNTGHKYGFIFVKKNNQDYCIAIDTIPTLSEYTKEIIQENNNLYITFNDQKYKLIMFGENQQKAMKGCGSFTLAYLKHLLKNNAEFLYEVINLEEKGQEDKTVRDVEKKSIIRGVKFEDIKNNKIAPTFYKFSQNWSLQGEFDDVMIKSKKGDILIKDYRNYYSATTKDKEGKDKIVSTKIFYITQKYKDATLKDNVNQKKFENILRKNNN